MQSCVGFVGSAHLKNILTNSSGVGVGGITGINDDKIITGNKSG